MYLSVAEKIIWSDWDKEWISDNPNQHLTSFPSLFFPFLVSKRARENLLMHRNWIVSDLITVRGLLFPAEIHCDVWGGSCSHSLDNQKSGQKGHGTCHHVVASVIDHTSFYRLEFLYFSFHTWQLVVWVWHVMTLRGELLSSCLPLTHYDPTPPSITGDWPFWHRLSLGPHSSLTMPNLGPGLRLSSDRHNTGISLGPALRHWGFHRAGKGLWSQLSPLRRW